MTVTISNGTDTWNPRNVDGYEATRRVNTVVRPILGTSDAVVTMRPGRRRAGTLRAFFLSAATTDVFELVEALGTPDQWTFADSTRSAYDMAFVVVGEVRIVLDDRLRRHWYVEIPYQEVSP